MSFLDREINPYWAWFSLAITNTIIYGLVGYELALFTTLITLLWYEMVIKSKNDANSQSNEVKKE